ncbi:30S ribosomal protein S4 [Rickettsiales bacterium]|nr:30S ribosomal protein S4 [Rickettsiales bacterium]
MTTIRQRKYLVSRRIGASLWGRDRDPVHQRNYPPGEHSHRRLKRQSDYGKQLRAKQILREYYNLRERQFKKIYKESTRAKGDTCANLIGLLESRFDAVLYHSKLLPTIFAARQFISHRHVLLNGKIVNIPSYRLKPGDTITIRDKLKDNCLVLHALKLQERSVPDYISVDEEKRSAQFLKVPEISEVPYPVKIDIDLVVVFYSR